MCELPVIEIEHPKVLSQILEENIGNSSTSKIIVAEDVQDHREQIIELPELPEEVEEVDEVIAKPPKLIVSHFNLLGTLKNNPIGRAILNNYTLKQTLDSQCQSYLCDIIVLHFLNIEYL